MRAIGTLNAGVASCSESQRAAITRARDVRSLARLQPMPLRPLPEHLHRGRELARVDLGGPFQVLHTTLTPAVHQARRQPSHSRQHVDRCDELLLGERRLRGAGYAVLNAVAGHRSSSRAMISRWMSEVPSSISSSLASRIHFSTGYSREYPQPPSVCTAAHVHHMAASDANSFAIAAS